MRHAALPAILLLAACTAPPSRDAAAGLVPAATPEREKEVHIHLKTGPLVLGGYTIVLTFDERACEIVQIESCKANAFPPGPHFSPDGFRSGQVVVSGLSTRRMWYDGGEYHLLTVQFRGKRPERAQLQAVLKDCYDVSRPPQPIKAELIVDPSVLDFSR